MSDIIQVSSYSDNLLPLLLSQFKDSAKLKSLIETALISADDIEQALFEIRDNFYLSTATGVQLDIIGAIFGLTRDGRTDADFRSIIGVAASNDYSGTAEGIVSALLNYYDATEVEIINENFRYLYAYSLRLFSLIERTDQLAALCAVSDSNIKQADLEFIAPAGTQAGIGSVLCDVDGEILFNTFDTSITGGSEDRAIATIAQSGIALAVENLLLDNGDILKLDTYSSALDDCTLVIFS